MGITITIMSSLWICDDNEKKRTFRVGNHSFINHAINRLNPNMVIFVVSTHFVKMLSRILDRLRHVGLCLINHLTLIS
ncbi:hypothetical protein D3C75_1220040 [compost metagenome]